jgi:DNA adenine methylase
MKPFLKWAGNKYRIIDRIKAVLPAGARLVEPFAGSGAVFLNTEFPEYLVADSNADLINLFKIIQKESEKFVSDAKKLFVPETNNQEVFYEYRTEFNESKDIYRKSVLFVYLNRHCFNGLCRYNSKGGFNVPFGRYTQPIFPENEIFGFSLKSQNVVFEYADFEKTLSKVKSGDVVYCDPPYVPINSTSNFTDYTKGGFGDEQQRKLANLAVELMNSGVIVVISNHDTAFTREIYSEASLNMFDVQRFISANATNRNKASELIAVFG